MHPCTKAKKEASARQCVRLQQRSDDVTRPVSVKYTCICSACVLLFARLLFGEMYAIAFPSHKHSGSRKADMLYAAE